MKRAGTTYSKATVPNSIPPTVHTPTEILPLAPTPWANIRGNMPKTIVNEVIRIGRTRALAAAMAAEAMDMPCLRRVEAYSVRRMAVLESRPISMIRPVCM